MTEYHGVDTRINNRRHMLEIQDPLFGHYAMRRGKGDVDSLVADVLDTPLGLRSLDITQLSKAEPHVTIPGTHRFHRFGHIAALAELTQRLARRELVDPQSTLAYVLKGSFSDLAHGPFSHATDIAIQGPGSTETFHEDRVEEAFSLGGVSDVFERHNVKVNARGEIEGIDVPDWVESSAPDMCVDRLQYTLQEMLLWVDGSDTSEASQIRSVLQEIASLKSIEIDDQGRMVFTDLEQARLLAKGFLLLSTEHWNDPVNRVQIYLLIEALKYSILNRRLPGMDQIDNGKTRRPYHYLYATDTDVLQAMQSVPGRTDQYLYAVEGQLADIGREEQRRFSLFKRPVYERFLTDPLAEDYPSAILHGDLVDFGPSSSRFEIELLSEHPRPSISQHPQVPQLESENGALHYLLFPLKNRKIDPLIRRGNQIVRLSEVDKNYASLLRQHQIIQQSSLRVTIPTTSAYKEILWQQAREVSQQFFDAQAEGLDLNRDPKRRGIQAAAQRSINQAISRGYYRDDREED